jgi:hypothetical protein
MSRRRGCSYFLDFIEVSLAAHVRARPQNESNTAAKSATQESVHNSASSKEYVT